MAKKRKDNRRLYISVFIIAVMVLSVMGFIFGGANTQSFKYNGHKFQVMDNNALLTYIDGKEAYFFTQPETAETIDVNSEIISRIKSTKMMYITFSQNLTFKDAAGLLQYQMSKELWDHASIYASPGLMENNTYNIPVITCENATSTVPVIIFGKTLNETNAYIEGDCIYIVSETQYGLVALKDRIMYGFYGIIQ